MPFWEEMILRMLGVLLGFFLIGLCAQKFTKMVKNERDEKNKFCEGKTVIDVGGCDNFGCSVRLSSGEKYKMFEPLKGEPCK